MAQIETRLKRIEDACNTTERLAREVIAALRGVMGETITTEARARLARVYERLQHTTEKENDIYLAHLLKLCAVFLDT